MESISSSMSSLFLAPRVDEEGERVERHFETFDEILGQIPNYPHLTKEIEETGTITQFMSKNPEIQEVERECLMEIYDLKNEMEHEHENYISGLEMIEAGKPKDLMDMSLEKVVKLMEKASRRPVEDFDDLLHIMRSVQGSTLEELINAENMNSTNSTSSHSEESLWSPHSEISGPLLSVSNLPSVAGSMISGYNPNATNQNRHIFPSASEMAQHAVITAPCTPGNSVYQFGGSSVMSTNKAPRLLKPGEVAFSECGSPLMMPRLGGLARLGGDAMRIPVNDADGKQIVEVVLYKGENDKEKEFRDFVTDVRGLVATKSIKKDRVRPARIQNKASKGLPPKGPGSATSASKTPAPWL